MCLWRAKHWNCLPMGILNLFLIQFNTVTGCQIYVKDYSMFWMQGFRVYTALSGEITRQWEKVLKKLTLTQYDKHYERGGGHVMSTWKGVTQVDLEGSLLVEVFIESTEMAIIFNFQGQIVILFCYCDLGVLIILQPREAQLGTNWIKTALSLTGDPSGMKRLNGWMNE